MGDKNMSLLAEVEATPIDSIATQFGLRADELLRQYASEFGDVFTPEDLKTKAELKAYEEFRQMPFATGGAPH